MEGRVSNDNLDSRGKPRVQTVNTDPSMTVQSDAHMADITNILKQFGQGGMEMLDEADLMFKDVSEFTDLQDALNQARVAEVEFLKLPSKVREIFNHDVAVWLDTAHDQDKRDALVEAGFLKVVEVDPPAGGPGTSPEGIGVPPERPPEAVAGETGAGPE